MAPEVNVWFRGKWYGPSYPGAGDLPAGRTANHDTTPEVVASTQADDVVNPAASAGDTVRDAPVPPPRSGSGSSRAKWAAYADANNVDYGGTDATRDDIIDACEAAGVPTT